MAFDIFGIEVKKDVVEVEVKKIDVYDFVDCIFCKRNKEKLLPFVSSSKYSQFIINNTLCSEDYISFIDELNLRTISNLTHFEYLYRKIPKHRAPKDQSKKIFIKSFIKTQKKDLLLEALLWKFKQRKDIVLEYIDLMDEDDLKELQLEHKNFLKESKKK